MKQFSRLFALIIFLSGVTLTQPKLSIDKPVIDLGTLYSGEKGKGKFMLKNIGNDTLRIYSIQPTCGCTTVKQPKGVLLPNESDDIEIEFNSTGYRGKVEKYVNINTNDPASPYLAVKLITDVKDVLQPASGRNIIWMENMVVGKPETTRVVMKNVSGVPVLIKGDSVSSPVISLKLDKKDILPNDSLSAEVTVKPIKQGNSTEYFYIKTNHRIQPIMEMRVILIGVKEN